MDTIADTAESVLRRHPAPALRLGELLRLVRSGLRDTALDLERLRAVLGARPDRFRILDPWRGPWRRVVGPSGADAEPEPWVVAVSDPGGDADRAPERALPRRLRASVRWMGVGVDDGSTWALARWHGIAAAEARVRARLSRAA